MGDGMNYITGVLLPLLDGVARVLTAALLLITLFLVQPVIALATTVGFGTFYVIVFRLLARKRLGRVVPRSAAETGRDQTDQSSSRGGTFSEPVRRPRRHRGTNVCSSA